MDAHREELLMFSFTCRGQDIHWAKSLLSDLGITKVIIKGGETRTTFDDGAQTGVSVQGMCSYSEFRDLTNALAKDKIERRASYSVN